jgi:hypothetical protein
MELPKTGERPLHGHDATYLFYQALDGLPRLNGISSFVPPSYVRFAERIRTFPDSAAVETIKSRGAKWLIVHGDRYPLEDWEKLQKALDPPPTGLMLEKKWGTVWLYRVD